nr:LysR substrate-binding domain-containing protein [Bordetella bronchiseptica]
MRHLDMQQLRTLVTIAQTGSFSATAEKLFKTQPAITHQMHQLEATLGTALFEKQGRSRVLTEDGQKMLKYASQVLALNDEVFRVFQERLQGTLRIGSPHDAVETLLPSILRQASQALPQLNIDVCIDRAPRLFELLQRGEIDMAISARFHQEFEGLILKRSPVVWLCAADYVHRPDKALPLILADGSSIYREMALAALEQHHIRWTVTRIVPDLVGIKAAIRAGLGVTPRSIDLLAPDMRMLGEADGLPPLPEMTYHLWIRPHADDSPARQAYEMLRQAWELVDAVPAARAGARAAG